MSLADNYAPVKTLGNGSTTQFTGSWNAISTDYIDVALENVTTGVQTPVTSGITKELLSTGGFRVTFATAPTSANYVVISRAVDLTQDTPYKTSSGFQGSNIEDSFDKITAMVQDQQDGLDRSIKTPIGDTRTVVLPSATVRANKGLKFDADGDVTVTLGDPDDVDEAVAAAEAAQAAAETAETNAATSATNAATSASGAASSASAASASASAAATSATAAASSASAAATSETNAAAAAAPATALLARVNSLPETLLNKNMWQDQRFNGLAGAKGWRGWTLSGSSITLALGTDSNDKPYINFSSASGKVNRRADVAISVLEFAAGDVITFSARIIASTVVTSGTNNQIRMVQLNSGGSEIAGTAFTVNIPSATTLASGDQIISIAAKTLDAACTKLRFDFYAYTSESWRMTDVSLHKGSNPNYRMPISERRDALVDSPAYGLPFLTKYPNYFNDIAFDTMAAALGSGSPDAYGAYATKDANCVATVGTNSRGEKTLTISSNNGSSANIYWYQLLANMGLAIGDTVSIACCVESRTGTSTTPLMQLTQREASGNEPTFLQIQMPTGAYTGPVWWANKELGSGVTIVAGTVAVDRLKLSFRVGGSDTLTISRVLLCKGSNQEYRPFIFDGLPAKATVTALQSTVSTNTTNIAANAADILELQATVGAVPVRNMTQLFIMGDSRSSHQGGGVDINGGYSAWGALNHFRMDSEVRGGFTVIDNTAVSGDRSDQYMTQTKLDAALATNAGWLWIWGITNDIFDGYTAQQAWDGYNGQIGIESAIDQALAAGMNVILPLESGSTAYGSSATSLGYVNQYNRLVREKAQQNNRVFVLDFNKIWWNRAGTSLALLTDMFGDGTHPQGYGSYLAAQEMKNVLLPHLKLNSIHHHAAWEAYANGAIQLIENPNFLTTTGGATSGTGITAASGVPANWTVATSGPGSPTVVVTTNTLPEGDKELVLDCTFGDKSDYIYILQGVSSVGTKLATGDELEAGFEIVFDSGFSNIGGATMRMVFVVDGVTTEVWSNDGVFKGGDQHPEELHQFHLIDNTAVPAGTAITSLNNSIRIHPRRNLFESAASTGAQVASCKVRIRRVFVRKKG